MLKIFTETFKSEKTKTKTTIEYIQSRLRSAKEINKRGGHVTMVYLRWYTKTKCLDCTFITREF